MLPELGFKQVREGARFPTYGSPGAIGVDLYACGTFILEPGDRLRVPVGFAAVIPSGYYGRIAPRSGLADRGGLDVLAGVIDPDYRGELVALLINHGPARVGVKDGTRIAQFIMERADRLPLALLDELPETARSLTGFGSTGVK